MSDRFSHFEVFMQRVEELGLRPQPRDDHRPTTEYPQMPAATCYLSSHVLAECFPELAVREGTLTWRVGQADYILRHAWNVTADGTIVDSTWTAPDGADSVTYWADDEYP